MFRELHPDDQAEEGPGHPEAAAGHHGPAQAGCGVLWQVHHQGPKGNLLRILQERRQKRPAGGIQVCDCFYRSKARTLSIFFP